MVTVPKPSSTYASDTRAWYDQRSEQWARKHNPDIYWKELRNEFEQLIGPNKRILDVGCGTGRDSFHFVNDGYRVVGIDFSKGMLEEARKYVPKADLFEMDMLCITLPIASFDGVWCCASLLHVKKSEARDVVLEMKRALKRDGIICVVVKEGEGEKFGPEKDGSERFFSYYTQDTLRSLLEGNGFKTIRARIIAPNPNYRWVCLIAQKL